MGGGVRNRIARLNTDGSLDSGFNPNADSSVYTIAVQADGKILVGGLFTSMGGQTRDRIARLNLDGSLDSGFNPNANSIVNSIAVQADGKILVGGSFTTMGGQTRNRIARINPDGSLDASFNPNVGSTVNSIAVQADGKIFVGGTFTSIDGVARNRLARLENTTAATQILEAVGDDTIQWRRGGSAPEVSQVLLEYWDGAAWVSPQPTVRIPGGWRMEGLTLPEATLLRATAATTGGRYGASSGIIRQTEVRGLLPQLAVFDAQASQVESGQHILDFTPVERGGESGPIKVFLRNTGQALLDNLTASMSGEGVQDKKVKWVV
jgi:uncharacterized delta-60 repeat protein